MEVRHDSDLMMLVDHEPENDWDPAHMHPLLVSIIVYFVCGGAGHM